MNTKVSDFTPWKKDGPMLVDVTRNDSYPIHIKPGLLEDIPNLLSTVYPGRNLVLINDYTVRDLYAQRTLDVLRSSNLSYEVIALSVPDGEQSKSLVTLTNLYSELLSAGVRRRSLLLAMGGGVITDLVGFLAATYMRGIPYVNIPTTLIAQADASVGGKTAVDLPTGKNLIGSFWHPTAVLIDPGFLRTLPIRQLRAGLAEVTKIAVICSPTLFEFLETYSSDLLGYSEQHLELVLTEALRRKIDLLAPDPYEINLRRSLNFGHTFGHPLEAANGYSSLVHGEAVALGMHLATSISLHRGLCNQATASRIFRLLMLLCLPVAYPSIDPLELWKHLQIIRLIRDNHLHIVLPTTIGSVEFADDVSLEEIQSALMNL